MEVQQPRQVKYRFVVLAVYLVASLVNSLPVNTFSGMNSTVQKLFEISVIEVTLNSLLFPISHTLFAFPCNWFINRYGIRFSYLIGGCFAIGGVWLRTFLSQGEPYLCLLGSLTAALGGIFVLNTSSKLAFNWFRSQIVPFITFLCVMCNLLSMSISLTLPGLLINSNSSKDDVVNFLRIEAAIVTIPFILLMIFIKDKPQIAPSLAAMAENNLKKQNYSKIMKRLFTNKEYIKCAFGMAFNYGILMSFLSIFQQALKGLGFTQSGKVISIVAVSGTVFGILGNYVFSMVLKKTQAYKYTAAAVNFGTFAGYLLLILGLMNGADRTITIVFLSLFFGFNYLSVPSIFILYSAEAAFPLDPASITGYLFALSQTFGFVGGIIFTQMLDKTQKMSQIVLCIIAVILFISFLVVLTTKQGLKKTRFEKALKNEHTPQQQQALKESLVTDSQI